MVDYGILRTKNVCRRWGPSCRVSLSRLALELGFGLFLFPGVLNVFVPGRAVFWWLLGNFFFVGDCRCGLELV